MVMTEAFIDVFYCQESRISAIFMKIASLEIISHVPYVKRWHCHEPMFRCFDWQIHKGEIMCQIHQRGDHQYWTNKISCIFTYEFIKVWTLHPGSYLYKCIGIFFSFFPSILLNWLCFCHNSSKMHVFMTFHLLFVLW